jgi:ArsR family transcriptional regulator
MNMRSEHERKARLLHALAHPIRYCIVEGLADGERDVSTMVECLDQPQPKISQHLNVLKTAGIIRGRRDGTRILYSVSDEDARRLVRALAGSEGISARTFS